MSGTGGIKRAVLIAGPTASGKSALALALAERYGGVVINADSMQVYRDLRIITARPTPEEEARAPHALYGDVDAAENYSVGRYVADAARAIASACERGLLPILVGGTGLYFRALTRGLAAIPPIPAAIRDEVRAAMEARGAQAMHAELERRDPVLAVRLSPADRTRIARALEVVAATGRSIAEWQRDEASPVLADTKIIPVFLAPAREDLRRRIDARFEEMLACGALDEARALAARKLAPQLPAMKAHGVPWLIRHLAGAMTLAQAGEEAKADTRRYAKRQFTWFRHQLPDWPDVAPEAAAEHLERRLEEPATEGLRPR